MDIVERLRKFSAITGGGSFCSREMAKDAADEIERLQEALQSIAKNTCCDTCQEAALVARQALGEKE